jgi:hypothetical protein
MPFFEGFPITGPREVFSSTTIVPEVEQSRRRSSRIQSKAQVSGF